jgi:hypothetical protein
MFQSDYELIAGVLAGERHDALTGGHKDAARQVEKTALALADAFARENRKFDPARFMLAVCEAVTPDGLPAPIRSQLAETFGSSERRRRPTPDPGLRPRELVDTGRWTERMAIGGAIMDVSSSHAASMAIGALNYYGDIHTLGDLAAKTDEELQAIPRIGPSALVVIREVRDLWRATQQAEMGPDQTAARQDTAHPARLAALAFPAANPSATAGRAAPASVGGQQARPKPTRARP